MDKQSFLTGYLTGIRLGRTTGYAALPEPWLDAGDLLGELKIGIFDGLTTSCIACRRPSITGNVDLIYIGYVANGIAGLLFANVKKNIFNTKWYSLNFSESAIDISVAFDGTMPLNNRVLHDEFITEESPWIFWVTPEGVAKCKKFGTNEEIILVNENCTRISAVRGAWGNNGFIDYGLIVFTLVENKIYYRQLIKNDWKDGEIVDFGPNVTWIDIESFRTGDYRVGLLCLDNNGLIYELYGKTQGYAKRLYEHILISSIVSTGILYKLLYYDAYEKEHLSISNVTSCPLYGGLYLIGAPLILNVYNIDNGQGDWGRYLVIKFDRHLKAEEVSAQYNRFSLVDSRNIIFTAISASLLPDGLTVILTIPNFNAAYGTCSLNYSPGTIHSMANYLLETLSFNFVPQNLVVPSTPLPSVVNIINI